MTSLLSLLINQFSLLLKNSKLLWNWNSIEVFFGTLLHIGFLGEKKGMLGSEKREERSLLPLPIIFPCALLPFPPLPSHKKPLQRRQDLKNCMAFLNQTMKGMKKKIIYWVAWGKFKVHSCSFGCNWERFSGMLTSDIMYVSLQLSSCQGWLIVWHLITGHYFHQSTSLEHQHT